MCLNNESNDFLTMFLTGQRKQNNTPFQSLCSAKNTNMFWICLFEILLFLFDARRWILMKKKKNKLNFVIETTYLCLYCVFYTWNVTVSIRKHFIKTIRVPYNESCSDYFYRSRSRGKCAKEMEKQKISSLK